MEKVHFSLLRVDTYCYDDPEFISDYYGPKILNSDEALNDFILERNISNSDLILITFSENEIYALTLSELKKLRHNCMEILQMFEDIVGISAFNWYSRLLDFSEVFRNINNVLHLFHYSSEAYYDSKSGECARSILFGDKPIRQYLMDIQYKNQIKLQQINSIITFMYNFWSDNIKYISSRRQATISIVINRLKDKYLEGKKC